MARPGDPFETDELDHLRAAQRRHLRLIRDDVVGTYAQELPPHITFHDVHPAAESGLRRRASEHEEGVLADYFAACERWRREAASLGVLEIVRQHGGSGSTLDRIRQDVETAAEDPPSPGSLEDVVGSFILLTLLADRLAADGYSDPRLAE